jgi:uncharacterized protein YjbJ (UPF0337 family)
MEKMLVPPGVASNRRAGTRRRLSAFSRIIDRHWRSFMDKDRIAGIAKQAKGTAKEVAGKVVGDAKLQADGKADKAAGKIQNAVGGVKDALRGK